MCRGDKDTTGQGLWAGGQDHGDLEPGQAERGGSTRIAGIDPGYSSSSPDPK
jgi:hypothetical protein